MTWMQFLNVVLINLFAWVAFSYFWSYWAYKVFKPFCWLQNCKLKKVSDHVKDLERTENDKVLFYTLWMQSTRIKTSNIVGDIVHVGLLDGTRSKQLLALMPDRKHHLFDFFEVVPQVEVMEDGDGNIVEQEAVVNPLSIRDLSQDIGIDDDEVNTIFDGTINEFVGSLANTPIALLYIDISHYDDTSLVLNSLYPALAKEGVIIIAGYNNKPSGRIKAVDEFQKSIPEVFVALSDSEGSIILIKNR